MKRIFIVEDHAIIRDTFRQVIEGSPELMVCGTAGSFEEAQAAIPKAAPDLVTMDVSLGRDSPDGIELIQQLNRAMNGRCPRWLVVSLHDDIHTRQRAEEAGAQGVLSKSNADTTLVDAILDALQDRP